MMTRPPKPPFVDPVTDAGKRAVELAEIAVEKYEHAHQVSSRAAKVQTNYRAAEKELATAMRLAGDKKSKRLTDAETAFADARAERDRPWRTIVQDAERAATGASNGVDAFMAANLDEVLTEPELDAAADAARDEIVEAASTLSAAFDRWSQLTAIHRRILRAAEAIDEWDALPGLTANAQNLKRAAQVVASEQSHHPVPSPKPTERAMREREALRAGAEAATYVGDFGL